MSGPRVTFDIRQRKEVFVWIKQAACGILAKSRDDGMLMTDCYGDVDGTDAATFKEDSGRSIFMNPCPNGGQDITTTVQPTTTTVP